MSNMVCKIGVNEESYQDMSDQYSQRQLCLIMGILDHSSTTATDW